MRNSHYIIFFLFFLSLSPGSDRYICSTPRPHTSTRKWLKKYQFYVNLCPLCVVVPVFEEHQDIPQGVPWQVWPSQQRAVWSLWPVWCQGLRQGEFNVFMLCFFPRSIFAWERCATVLVCMLYVGSGSYVEVNDSLAGHVAFKKSLYAAFTGDACVS